MVDLLIERFQSSHAAPPKVHVQMWCEEHVGPITCVISCILLNERRAVLKLFLMSGRRPLNKVSMCALDLISKVARRVIQHESSKSRKSGAITLEQSITIHYNNSHFCVFEL